ncbi:MULTISPECIES: alpha/beta hydrolase fold domain-containing protein [unclassified Isoptericola]|uniref:alpha/beta hydrolase fold domain-containing protein n=1 Tax=unclassified Isoptericola TaxID=2623355 RepID=UPI00364C5A64
MTTDTTDTSTATSQVTTADRVLDGPHGDLRVRVYTPGAPTGSTPVAGLVWAHGGGFMHGDLDMPEADGVARRLAEAGVLVVSVDYRLVASFDDAAVDGAPVRGDGVRFPAPSEEVAFAFGWARAAGLGVPADRWSIGGASAGGNLAAGASLRLRDAGTPVRSTLLAYPVAHHELPAHSAELAAKVAAIPGGSFPPAQVRAMNDNYLGHRDGPTSPYAFPGGSGPDALRGLAPTFVLTSDHDGLRSMGEAYAAELAAAGVDVLLVREDGTTHGHLNQPEHPGCARSLARMTAWLTVDALVGAPHEPAPGIHRDLSRPAPGARR